MQPLDLSKFKLPTASALPTGGALSDTPKAGLNQPQFKVLPLGGTSSPAPAATAPTKPLNLEDFRIKPKLAPEQVTANNIDDINKQSAEQFSPTFPAQGSKEGFVSAPAKALGNIPSSAVNFGKGILNFLNPVKNVKTIIEAGKQVVQSVKDQGVKGTLETLAKNIPDAAYHTLVPQFIQNAVDYAKNPSEETKSKLLDTVVNDPVGQFAPLILVSKGIADKAGVGEHFDTAMKAIADPVINGAKKTGSALARTTGTVGKTVLGFTTGAGPESIAGDARATPEFTQAMRGEKTPEQIVDTAQNMFEDIRTARRAQYLKDFKSLDEYKKSSDITPIHDQLEKSLNDFGVKVDKNGNLDFSRSSIANKTEAKTDIQGVYDNVKEWGKLPGDRTVIGLDTLKKQLDDLYSPSGQARAFVQAVKSSVRDVIVENYPKYEKMTQGYQDASEILNNIKSATGLGGKAGYDTVFTKLTRALKSDNSFRKQMLDTIEQKTGSNLKDYISGANLSGLAPKGIAGQLTDVGVAFQLLRGMFNPAEIPAILSTSPRVVGEFVRALGVGTRNAAKVIDAVRALGTTKGAEFMKTQLNPSGSLPAIGVGGTKENNKSALPAAPEAEQ